MTEMDRLIYKPRAFQGNTVFIYDDDKLTPEKLISIIMDLVDEEVQEQRQKAQEEKMELRRLF
jgi:hypothetical protein